MKKIYLMMTLVVSALTFAQTTIYSENFGNATGNTALSAHTGYQATTPITYTGTADIRITTPSTGYPDASGQACVFIGGSTAAPARELIVSGINTQDYENLVFSFGHQKGTNVASNELLVSVSSDGTNYTPLSYTRPSGNNTSVWLLITPTGSIPSTATLSIKFTNPVNSNVGFRIDDLKLVGTLKELAVSNTSKTKFNVFPTVVNNGIFYVTSENNAAKNVKVYDQTSKLIINTKTEKEVNVADLTKGVYIVTVEQNGVVETKKIVIK